MGWFSKAIPERKWADASTALGLKLQVTGGSWYSTFQHGTASHGFVLAPNGISDTAKPVVSGLFDAKRLESQ